MLKAAFPRPRVTDFQPQPEEIIAKIRIENDLFVRHTLNAEDLPALENSEELYKKIEGRLSGTGIPLFDRDTKELRFLKYIDQYLYNDLMKLTDKNEALNLYVQKINELVKEHDKAQAQAVHDQRNDDLKHREILENAEKSLKVWLSEVRKEAKQLTAQKSRPARVFTEEEKSRNLHWQDFSEEDLTRSKENLIDKKLALKKEIKRIDSAVNSIDEKIWPHSEKIDDLKKMLETDLKEEEFKNAKLSIEFNEAQIEKYRREMLPFFDEVHELHQQVEKIDKQLPMLDLCIDAKILIRDATVNFPRRKERLILRLNQILKQMNELENLRTNLNARWKDLTGDRENLIGTLGLRVDSQLFFV